MTKYSIGDFVRITTHEEVISNRLKQNSSMKREDVERYLGKSEGYQRSREYFGKLTKITGVGFTDLQSVQHYKLEIDKGKFLWPETFLIPQLTKITFNKNGNKNE